MKEEDGVEDGEVNIKEEGEGETVADEGTTVTPPPL
jgi:hypothetical protein